MTTINLNQTSEEQLTEVLNRVITNRGTPLIRRLLITNNMNIEFTNNICDYIALGDSLYNINRGIITFSDPSKYGAAITKIKGTLYVESITLHHKDINSLSKALEVIFNIGYNVYKDIRVIETDGETFYNIDKGGSFFCEIRFTFKGDSREKYFNVLTNNSK